MRGLHSQLKAGEDAVAAQEAAVARQRVLDSQPSTKSETPTAPRARRIRGFVDANQLFGGEVRPGDESWDNARTPHKESQRMAQRWHGRFFRAIQGGAHHKG